LKLEEIEQEVLKYFSQNIKEVSVDDDLISDGVLDSMEIVKLIVFLEEKLGLKIDHSRMNGSNFRSVRNIIKIFDSND